MNRVCRSDAADLITCRPDACSTFAVLCFHPTFLKYISCIRTGCHLSISPSVVSLAVWGCKCPVKADSDAPSSLSLLGSASIPLQHPTTPALRPVRRHGPQAQPVQGLWAVALLRHRVLQGGLARAQAAVWPAAAEAGHTGEAGQEGQSVNTVVSARQQQHPSSRYKQQCGGNCW